MSSMSDLAECKKKIREWQAAQFPNATLYGAQAHLQRELAEAAEEMADVFHLATHCETMGADTGLMAVMAWIAIGNLGLDPADIIMSKLAKNQARKWPDTPDADGCFAHILET